jgi:hypothetical protein
MAHRVGNGKPPAAQTEAPPAKRTPGKPPRAVFNVADAVDAEGNKVPLDDKGRLTAVPANYDPLKFKPLASDAFASADLFFDYRALIQRSKSVVAAAAAVKLEEKASLFRRFGDSAKRAKVARMVKAREEFATLQAQLIAEGVDMEDLKSL